MAPDRNPAKRSEVLQGTLEMLALKLLSVEAMHGWGLSLKLREISRDVFDVNQGSLYPALQRLEKDGLIASDWGTTDNNRRARYYRLTASGRRALGVELASWRKFTVGLEAVLKTT
jgi:PadR family transcriptional regulator PadR